MPKRDAQARAILLDIEGTTTPVDFVYQTLFPFARRHVKEFLDAHSANEAVKADITRLRQEHAAEASDQSLPIWRDDSLEAQLESAVAYVHWLMDRDRKSTGLKSLQGKIWEAGYRSGELHGEVYEDVPRAFARWKEQQQIIAIFSSGSVLAQQLLFAHSTAGDLTGFLQAYFDTTTGAKREAESYRRIAASLRSQPSEILFLSDVIAELDAARLAGMQTALCVRTEPSPPAGAHPVIRTFAEVFP
ncbi:MAG: acireductone synthase [Blastocatellia bacterium]